MWTLRGWKETDKDGNEIMVAEEIPKEKPRKEASEEPNDKEPMEVENESKNEEADPAMVEKLTENESNQEVQGKKIVISKLWHHSVEIS